MKSITLLFLSVCLLAYSACKKSTTAGTPPIVGTWAFTNISGIDSFNYLPAIAQQVTTYSYNSATNTIMLSTTDSGQATPVVTSLKVNSEIWTFNADGTYSINESYASPGNQTITSDSSGTWKYVSSATKNSYVLTGPSSIVLQSVNSSITHNGTYILQVTGNTMALTDFVNAQYSVAYTDSVNIAVSFTRQ